MDEIINEIYQLVKKKMREQAAVERDAYTEIVDETIEYFMEKGKLSDDDNIEFIKDQLDEMYESATDSMADEENEY
ncbi:MAG: hypothetical protein WCO55_06415 [Candidatus Falkowbacteria bacterium]